MKSAAPILQDTDNGKHPSPVIGSPAQIMDHKTVVGSLWRRENDRARCLACGHRCLIAEGRRGICKVRFNRGGELHVPSGYVAGAACDPVEKKPFLHVYPGSEAFTFGMLGCDFHCAYCQNWVTSQALRDPASLSHTTPLSSGQLVSAARCCVPFLQILLANFKIVPVLVGDARDEEICAVIEQVWGGPETRFVISSDLSHDRDYLSAQRLDNATAKWIERLCSEKIGQPQACGSAAVRGMMVAANRHQLRSHAIDLRNSGDTAGPRDQVVGYGAFTFCNN